MYLLPVGTCGTKDFVSGSFHTNLVFLTTLVRSWNEKAEVEPDSNCTPSLLQLWVFRVQVERRLPAITASGA